jgi:hypothetical protein
MPTIGQPWARLDGYQTTRGLRRAIAINGCHAAELERFGARYGGDGARSED